MQAAPVRFNRRVLVFVVGAFLAVIGGIYAVQQRISMPSLGLGALAPESKARVQMPQDLLAQTATYGPVKPPRQEPSLVVQPVVQSFSPSLGPSADDPPWPVGVPAQVPTATPMPAAAPPAAAAKPVLPSTVPAAQPVQQTSTEKKAWGITPRGINFQSAGRQPTAKEQEAETRKAEAEKLIKPAIWSRPLFPRKTLYRQQAIPGVTIDAMNSSIPGQYRIRVTVPVFDRFERKYELIPKDSVIIIKQENSPMFGDRRLQLTVEEIQPPTPEVISLKAAVGDSQGASGVTGRVDNHIPQLLLATGISAVLSIAPRVLAGNPEGFQYNVGQEVAREAGSQVSQDAKGIVDKVLRIPPTIYVPANTPVSVSLLENVQFSRQPIVVR